MNDREIIFTSYCFGEPYLQQQARLRNTIKTFHPNSQIHFKSESEHKGKPRFQYSLYGFKPRMIRECLSKGFKKIIFFDPAITLVDRVDHWFELTKERGVLAIADNQNLYNVTSDRCLYYMGMKREGLTEIKLVGGSIYVFDFDNPVCNKVFLHWEKMEREGMFGNQDDLSHDRLQGHRMDETCMALSMFKYGVKPVNYSEIRYGYEHPNTGKITKVGESSLIALKKHFK